MVVGLGVDLFDVARMEAEFRKADPDFTRQLFTHDEIARCERQRRPAEQFALCFAAKEAIAKALAGDDRCALAWPDIDIRGDPGGEHEVVLHGRARARADTLGVGRILLSVARARGVALASVVLESSP
jgi:holo-[acyl-carrier protein] synthase